MAIGVGEKSSCVVRGIGKNVIVAIAMAMNDDYRVAELLNAAVKLYNNHQARRIPTSLLHCAKCLRYSTRHRVMAKKKYKEKVKTVVVQPTDEQVRRVLIENTPMKEEMESWMGCKMFTLSCLTLHATVEDLIKYTQQLQLECVPEWFADNRQMRDFMHCYLGDIEQLLKMVLDLKLVRPYRLETSDNMNYV